MTDPSDFLTDQQFVDTWGGISSADYLFMENLDELQVQTDFNTGNQPAQYFLKTSGTQGIQFTKTIYVSSNLIIGGNVYYGYGDNNIENEISYQGDNLLTGISLYDNTWSYSPCNIIIEGDLYLENVSLGADTSIYTPNNEPVIYQNVADAFGNITGYQTSNLVCAGDLYVRGNIYYTSNYMPVTFAKKYVPLIIGSCNICDEAVKVRHLNLQPSTVPIGVVRVNPYNLIKNKLIDLWDNNTNDHQFYGFGINPYVLRYQVTETSASHIFYSATSPFTSLELMRIQGNGKVTIGTSPNYHQLTVNQDVQINAQNTYATNHLVLYDRFFNANQFFGFGVENATSLAYTTENSGCSHNFYCGSGTATRRHLLKIDGNYNIRVNPANTLNYRLLTLWDNQDNNYNYYGFGINTNTLIYNVTDANASHVFYNGASGFLNELVRITGTGRLSIDNPSPSYPLSIGVNGAGFPTPDGSAPMYASRAWVNFNGNNGNIRGEKNITSVTRNATGDYTITINTNMPNINYSAVATGSISNGGILGLCHIFTTPFATNTPGTGSFRLTTTNLSGAVLDLTYICVSVFC